MQPQPQIELKPVESSNISAIGYDQQTGTLAVQFTTGAIYHYFDVSEAIWEAFQEAKSKGVFLSQAIRGYFTYEKVAG